jgi:DNA-binding beta-propeller fold protein YncE
LLPVRALIEGIGYTAVWDAGTVVIRTHGGWRVSTFAGTGIHGYRDGHDPLFNLPASIFAHGAGVLVADTFNNLIRTVSPGGYTSLLAGAVLPPDEFDFPRGAYRSGAAPFFNRPTGGVTCDEGRIFIADSQNNAIRVIVGGTTYTYAGGGQGGHRDGDIGSALFYRPMAVAFGPCGGLFVADTFNDAVRRISPEGYVTTVAQGFNMPMGIAVCAQGRIFVADTGNHLIRIIEDGQMRTLAGTLQFDEYMEPAGGFANGMQAMFNLPVGLSLRGDELFVADSANHAIRMVSAAGNVQTVAGMGEPGYTDGYAHAAQFHFPRGVLVHGNRLYVADTGNNIIRVLAEGSVQ